MGFFDFLHGTEPKSDAELYMEQRNKEFTQKARAYKQKENRHSQEKESKQTQERYIPSFSAYDPLPNEQKKKSSVVKRKTTVSSMTFGQELKKAKGSMSPILSTLLTEAAKELEKRASGLSDIEDTEDCDVCDVPDDESVGQRAAFRVTVVSNRVDPEIQFVNGIITKGGFKNRDRVKIATYKGEYDAVIEKIARQGEQIDYANVSSGMIALRLRVDPDIDIDENDVIFK